MGTTSVLNWNFEDPQTSSLPSLFSAFAALPLVSGNITSFKSAVDLALNKVMKKTTSQVKIANKCICHAINSKLVNLK